MRFIMLMFTDNANVLMQLLQLDEALDDAVTSARVLAEKNTVNTVFYQSE